MQNRLFFKIILLSLKIRLLNFIFFLFFMLNVQVMDGQSPEKLYNLACTQVDNGNFMKAEKYLSSILIQQEKLTQEQIVAVYNELGIIGTRMGKYEQATLYFTLGEKISLENMGTMRYKLPSIYNNLGNIFKYRGDYAKALVYYRESLDNLNARGLSEQDKRTSLAHSYCNMGIVYCLEKEYSEANKYFEKSISTWKKYGIEGLDIVYSNYANSLRERNNFELAEIYYRKCIEIRIKKYGPLHYRLAYVYADKGKLECRKGDLKAGLDLYQKALDISLANYGKKHPYTAEMYQIIGDYYSDQKNFERALHFYQQSLIANSGNFNETDIERNPLPDHVYSEIQLLRSFKKKSDVLLAQANQSRGKTLKISRLELCIQTVEIAVHTLQKVRQGYLSAESKLFITKSEKEFFMNGLDCALQLYELTGVESNVEKAYSFSRESKAAVLLNEIKQNEAFLSILPDSLKKQKDEITQNLASLKKLVLDENMNLKPDQVKISAWQSQIFQWNKKYEQVLAVINKNYPAYNTLMAKAEPMPLPEIRNRLLADETLIEYSYSLNENKGELYIFALSKKGLKYFRQKIESSFEQNIELCRKKMDMGSGAFVNLDDYNRYNQNLYWLYCKLIKPAKSIVGKRIIIVPDEKIAWLSFDALISDFKKESFINYSAPSYLLYDYTFSYAYSSNLLFNKSTKQVQNAKVYAFAPGYHAVNQNQSRYLFGELKNAQNEIKTILKYFKGEAYTGDSATKSNFKSALGNHGIYHLAMHANPVPDNPDYAYLAFSQGNNTGKNSFLYNYEISSLPASAGMIVLSACNTGDGKIYSGEGVMSLGRGFILAGIPSVVHGLWKLNDESSSLIMGNFYKYLSEGKAKNEALRLAKIDYIKYASPELANPVYWSGIVLMGDREKLVTNIQIWPFVVLGLITASFVCFYWYTDKN